MILLLIAAVLAIVVCSGILIALAMRRYRRLRAGFHFGRSGFYLDAGDGPQGDFSDDEVLPRMLPRSRSRR